MCASKKNIDGPPASPSKLGNKSGDVKKSSGLIASPKRFATKKFLDTILASKELTAALESFLESEFCLENLVFIQKTANYREAFAAADIDKMECRIQLQELREDVLKDFMLPTSEREINIPAKIKRECLAQMEILKSTGLKMDRDEYNELGMMVFDRCEQHVKTVLVQERIGRFQQTDGFTKIASATGIKEN